MTNNDEQDAVRAVCREVTLTLLGVFDMYGADTPAVTAAARGLADVFCAHLPELARPRASRGRASLRALLNELERTSTNHTQSDQGERQ